MFEWFKEMPELLQGSLLTILGFGFAVAWDINKSKKEKAEKEKSILLSLGACLEENISRIEKNRRILWHEEDINKENPNNYNDTPFVLLDTTQIWTFFTLHVPDKVTSDSEFLSILRDLAIETEFVNHTIQGRDLFRTTQGATRPFTPRIIDFGKRIGNGLNVVEQLVKSAQSKLKT